ncbi:MAG: hypothetical protein HY548_05170, partial [Elusimicrobia bacterium]|nr:hypothetical protein [Elusimicrobiota bacterium]
FFSAGTESPLLVRGEAGASFGPDRQSFRLGGPDRVRGVSRRGPGSHVGRFALGRLEWNPLLRYTRARGGGGIFPSVVVKAIYGAVFTDAAYGWERGRDLESFGAGDIRHSVGAGLRLPSFILERFPITFAFDVSKRTDASDWNVFLYIGSFFFPEIIILENRGGGKIKH